MALVLEDLRRVGSATLEPLMREESEFWLDILGWDYRPTQDFLRTYIDNSVLPGFVLIESGRAVGYAYLVVDAGRGVIGDLYVMRERWGGDLEAQLAAASFAVLKETPFVRRIEAQLMVFSKAELESVFINAGFETFRRHFLLLELGSYNGGRAEPEGLEMRPWDDSMIDEAARIIYESYVGGIDAYFSSSFGHLDRCHGFVVNLVRRAGCGGFVPRMTTVGYLDDKMAGVVVATELSPGVGHLPQISVAPGHQGSGIGAYLVDESLQRFGEAGYGAVSLTVTEQNERAEQWYRRIGFAEVLPFSAYLWQRDS